MRFAGGKRTHNFATGVGPCVCGRADCYECIGSASKEMIAERKRIVKELAKEKRKRKRILKKTKALSEAEMAAEIVARQMRGSAKARADA